ALHMSAFRGKAGGHRASARMSANDPKQPFRQNALRRIGTHKRLINSAAVFPFGQLQRSAFLLSVMDRIAAFRVWASEDRMRRKIALTLMLVASIAGIALAQSDRHDDSNSARTNCTDSTFALQMMQAMDRMDSGMMAAKLTDDPDRDFAAMMIPHHQGAIDMAKAELIYGHDPVLRRLAEGIIVEQQQEIELMQR